MKAIKQRFYILNTVNDKNYDEVEGKFYANNWEPQYSDDKLYLLNLIMSDRIKFKDCIVEEI